MIKLGQKVKDKITGFEGIVIAKVEYLTVEYLTGCIQYCVKPQMRESGKMPEGSYIDEVQLEVIDEMPKPTPIPSGGVGSDVPSICSLKSTVGLSDWFFGGSIIGILAALSGFVLILFIHHFLSQ